MSNEKEIKTEKFSGLSSMRKCADRIFRAFVKRLHQDDSALAISNEKRLIALLRRAKRSLGANVCLPVTSDGLPYLFHFSERFFSLPRMDLTEEEIGRALERLSEKHLFYDTELMLLSSFMMLSAAEIYAREGKPCFLQSLIVMEGMRFDAYFFAFSEVGKIFAKEKASVYLDSDLSTRRLYHLRLQKLCQKRKTNTLEEARRIVDLANEQHTHIGDVLTPGRRHGGLCGAMLFCTLLLLVVGAFLLTDAEIGRVILLFVTAFPLYGLARLLFEPFFFRHGERILPRLARGEILEKTGVLVSVSTVLSGEAHDGRIFDSVEDFYLTNSQGAEKIVFAVVCDLPKSKKRTTDRDIGMISYAEDRIRSLNAKYGPHFALFVRGRRRSEHENAYVGWEGKDGGVLELCHFLRGKQTSFMLSVYETEMIFETKYLITLEENIHLHAGAVHEMLCVMLHPENQPRWDPESGFLTKGYAFLQPKIRKSLSFRHSSFYETLAFQAREDTISYLWDEDICRRNGMMDVDVFLAVCDGFFSRESRLRCDLAFCDLLRCGRISDVSLFDGAPQNAVSDYQRVQRRILRCLKNLPYLFRFARRGKGEYARNPLSPILKCRIFDAIMQEVTPFMSVLALLTGCIIGDRIAFRTAIVVFSPILWRMIRALFFDVRCCGFRGLGRAFACAWLRVSALAYDAFVFADAFLKTIFRFVFQRHRLISSPSVTLKNGCLDDYVLRFSPSMMIGLCFFCLPGLVGKILGIFWMGMPIAFFALSRNQCHKISLCEKDREALMRYASDAWGYFRDHVNADSKWLPVERVQILPAVAAEKTTSPTDIGFYLLAALGARDLGWIDSGELAERSFQTAKSLKMLFRWNGHLYHRYSLDTLAVEGDSFVFSADSGSFVTALVAFCEGAKEYASQATRLLDVIADLEEIIRETDFGVFYDSLCKQFYVGYDGERGVFTRAHHDTFMSEARLLSYYATASGSVPREHYYMGARHVIGGFGEQGIASCCGTASSFFIPQLLLQSADGSMIARSLTHAYREQRRHAAQKTVLGKRRRVFGRSESGFFDFDGAMHYRSQAFCAASLSLESEASIEPVIAPYASFLMLEEDPERLMENLSELEAFGMYGKYGFYEALDLASCRVGCGYACIQRFTSRHLSMSIVSVCNLLQNGIFRKRFMRQPMMRASRELLCERMPRAWILCSAKRKKERPSFEDAPPRYAEHEQKDGYAYTLLHPEMALVSNHKTRILASSSGHIAVESGSVTLVHSAFDPYGLRRGLRIYVSIDGVVLPTVPLMADAPLFSSRFMFSPRSDVIVYRSHHVCGEKRYRILLTFSVFPDRDICEISCEVQGVYQHAFVYLYFEPIVSEKRDAPASARFFMSEYYRDEGVLLYKRESGQGKREGPFFGVRSFPQSEEHAFETTRERWLPPMAGERELRCFWQEHSFTNSLGATETPCLAMVSAPLGGRQSKARFYLGIADDADDLLYELSHDNRQTRRMREMKMRNLLTLQYRVSGLSCSVEALERYVLRAMAFGLLRPRAEHDCRLDRRALRRFSVSGDNPIVLVRISSQDDVETARLREVIGLFKYMCIRGVRYDLVLLYRERDSCKGEMLAYIMRELCRAGCDGFVSWSCGIFCVEEGCLDWRARFTCEVTAVVVFDLSTDIRKTAMENARALPASKEIEILLKKEAVTRPFTISTPGVKTMDTPACDSFHENGVLVQKPHSALPFSHILSSENFGTVMTENSLGFTFSRDADTGRLTPHSCEAMVEDFGERLYLRVYDLFGSQFCDYDLCAIASRVDFCFDEVVYHGRADEIDFSVTVSLLGKADLKQISVSLESGVRVRIALIFCVRPALGEYADFPRFYRFYKEKQEIRILRFSDDERKNGELFLFSKAATVSYTDQAALLTDGAFFRGESDAGVLIVKGELFGRKTVQFYLGCAFSSRHLTYLRELTRQGESATSRRFVPYAILKTDDALFDAMVNHWGLHQLLSMQEISYPFRERSGIRSHLQRAFFLLSDAPEMARAIIFYAAAHQEEKGTLWNFENEADTWTRDRDSDVGVLFAYVTQAYVEATGDVDILNPEIPYRVSPPFSEGGDVCHEAVVGHASRESLRLHIQKALASAERSDLQDGDLLSQKWILDSLLFENVDIPIAEAIDAFWSGEDALGAERLFSMLSSAREWCARFGALYRYAVLTWLCGYSETMGGFTLTPRLSRRFSSFSLKIRKKGTVYHICVSYGLCNEAILDGKKISPHACFLFDCKEHTLILKCFAGQ